MNKAYLLVALLIALFCALTFAADKAPQCEEPPSLIPDTFSISYSQDSGTSGTLYFTYIEPAWEEWQMFDIRELASDPFTAEFTVSFKDSGIELPSTFDITETSACKFKTPQSYTRDNAASAQLTNSNDQTIQLSFRQTGSFYCTVKPLKKDFRGKQQTSIEGTLSVRTYNCDDGKATSSSTSQLIDGASKISMPDLYVHDECTRTTFTFEAPYQLTSKQINGLALDITSLDDVIPISGLTAKTMLHSYTIDDTFVRDGERMYKNVLSFCTFNATVNVQDNNSTQLADFSKKIFTGIGNISTNIKQSKIPSYCYNGIKDFDESDVDCGGSGSYNGCPPCVDSSQICNGNSDCVSGICQSHELAGKRCVALNAAGMATYSAIMAVVVMAVALLF